MNSKKAYFTLIGLLVVVALGLLLSVYEANTLLGNKSNALVLLKAKKQATDNQKSQLSNDNKEIATYATLNQIAQSVVPQDKDQAEAVREIVDLASQSGISQLSSVTFPASTLGGTAVGAGSGAKTPALTQLVPVKGISGVYSLAITITQDDTNAVPYSDFITFLGKLEQNRRTAEVSSISINPDQKNPSVVAFTLTVNEFIKP